MKTPQASADENKNYIAVTKYRFSPRKRGERGRRERREREREEKKKERREEREREERRERVGNSTHLMHTNLDNVKQSESQT